MPASSKVDVGRIRQTGGARSARPLRPIDSGRTAVQRAKATLRPLRFDSGIRSGPVELSPRMAVAERVAVEFWIQRMPECFARQLLSHRRRPLKIAVADRLISISGRVFINQRPPQARSPRAENRSAQRLPEPFAASYIPERYIVLERALFRRRIELGRILYHELGHFLWPRLGHRRRRRFQESIRRELRERVRGELGYSAEVRKASLSAGRRPGGSRQAHARQLRDYFCESFCDTGAYVLLGGARRVNHSEFTLSRAARERRVLTWKEVAMSGER